MDSVVVTNTRHRFFTKVAETFYPHEAKDRLLGEELNMAIAIALDYPTPDLGGEEQLHFEYMEGPGPDDMVVEYLSYLGGNNRFDCPFARCVKHFLEYRNAYYIALGNTPGLRIRLCKQELTIGLIKAVMRIEPRSGINTDNNLRYMLQLILDMIALVHEKSQYPTHGLHPTLKYYWNQIEIKALNFIKTGSNPDWSPPKKPIGFQGKVRKHWFRAL